MIQKFMKSMAKKNNKKGFTLVELMVVVVIIGILVAIAVPVYNGTQSNAKKQACLANQRTINGAVAQWQAEKATDAKKLPVMGDLVSDKYLQAIPKCGGTAYSTIDANGRTSCPASDATHVLP